MFASDPRPHRVWALLLLLCPAGAAAGPIFVTGHYDAERVEVRIAKPKAADASYQVRFGRAEVEIDDDSVRSRRESIIAGPADSGPELVGLLPLSAASPIDVAVQIDGRAVSGHTLDAADAATLYAGLARNTDDSRWLALAGRPVHVLPGVRLGKRSHVVVEILHPLGKTSGFDRVEVSMPAVGFARGPARRFTVTATYTGRRPLRAITSPTHDVEIERNGARGATVRLALDEVTDGEPLVLLSVRDDDAVGLRVLTHRAEGEPHGYFLLVGSPTGDGDDRAPPPKDLILVLDTSGSMRGEKMAQARVAIADCIDRLGAEDRFNLITFGSEVRQFRPGPVAATPEARAQARTFVDELVALGRTHMSGALAAAFGDADDTGRPRAVIFVTDGAPTAGELDPEKIIAALPAADAAGHNRVFVLGVGHDVNTHLLDRLAERSGGSTIYVAPEDALDEKMAALYDRLSAPALADLDLDFGNLEVVDRNPRHLPPLFRGETLLVVGRYRGGGHHQITLKGRVEGQTRSHGLEAEFAETARPEHDFIAALWAARRVGALLRDIRLEGPTPAAIEEVVELSRSFGILTEYTRFLGDADAPVGAAEAQQRAESLLVGARVHTAGSWAVRQADNEQTLRHKVATSNEANRYVDRRGKKRKAANIKKIGRRAFYKRDGRWVEAADGKKRESRRVRKFSPEYMELVRDNADFAKAQALDADVSMSVDNAQIEVY